MPVSAGEMTHHRPTPCRQSPWAGRAAKRVIDLVGAAVLLLLLAPMLLVAAVAVKVDTPGPLVFRQRRTGWRGEEFHVVKLRTMRVGSEELREALAARNEADGHLFKIQLLQSTG